MSYNLGMFFNFPTSDFLVGVVDDDGPEMDFGLARLANCPGIFNLPTFAGVFSVVLSPQNSSLGMESRGDDSRMDARASGGGDVTGNVTFNFPTDRGVFPIFCSAQ